MKKFFLIGLVPLVIGFACGYTIKAFHKHVKPSTVTKPEKPTFETYRQISTRLPKEFDILLPCSQSPRNLAVAMDVIDQSNYYLIEFSDRINITKFENGIKAKLASAAMPADLPGSYNIVIKRRLRDIIITVDGRILAQAYDGTFSRGGALLSSLEGLNASDIKVQRVGEIFFADDFMKGAGPASEWQALSGNWDVNITEYTVKDSYVKEANTSLSSNAFYYVGKAANHTIYPMRVPSANLQASEQQEKSPRAIQDIVDELTAKLNADGYLKNLDIKAGSNSITVRGTVDSKSVQNFRKLALTVDGIRPATPAEQNAEESAVKIRSKDGTVEQAAECNLCIDSTEGVRRICEYLDTSDASLKVLDFSDEQLQKELQDKLAADRVIRTYRMEITVEGSKASIACGPLPADDYARLKTLTETVRGLQQADFSLPAMSIAGYWFWDNYSFQASCLPAKDGSVALCFYYRDPHNYYLFRWSGGADGKKQLIEVRDSKERVLAEETGGCKADVWYALRVAVNQRMIRAYIDDNLIFTAYDNGLCAGKIGLCSYTKEPARFDDVFVQNDFSRFDSFAGSLSQWQRFGGTWKTTKTADGSQLTASANRPSKLITGEDDWRNYTISVEIPQLQAGTVGLAARYRDEANHYLYTVSADGSQRLVAFVNGQESLLAEKQQTLPADAPAKLFLSAENDVIHAGVNGTVLLEGWDDSISSGRAGLYIDTAGPVTFRNAALQMIHLQEPVLTTNEIFSREKTMENWASKLSDWLPSSGSFAGKSYAVSWHRADFPGDIELTAKLDEAPAGNTEARLVISAQKQDLASGYCLSLASADGLQFELFKDGKSIAKAPAEGKLPLRISLKKKGSYVIAMLNFKPVLKVKDDAPLDGMIIGVAQAGVDVPKEEVQVFCPNVFAYTFDKAACDWRPAAGSWMVRNRWQCDPRWSFFSGVSEPNQEAIIWSKRLFDSTNVTLEFAAGMKMDAARGGNYEYASDMDATICADGKDLTSGYSFMFGALGNTSTRIMKGNTVLAETKDDVIPNQPGKPSIHRRWFYFKIRKIGSKLEYYVDNKLVLECTDPEPLTGKRLALWTHNNGIMIAKVRMSCTNAETKESPDFQISGTPKTFYTKASQK